MIKEEAKKKIAELLSKYEQLTPAEIKNYHEAKTKQGFVLPLFQYLGWDISNINEVAPEEKVSKGRVDYAFKLHDVSHFYLEVKALKAELNKLEYKNQVITYAYNKGVTWAILTDFEGIKVFNAQTSQPFLNLEYKDYLTDFDKLWLLSKDSIQSGLLDKEAAKYGALPVAIPIEKRLYSQLRQWREQLFAQLYHYNPGLSFEQIDEIIQRFFNRIIFIRTCEDRGIEEKILLSAVHQWNTKGFKGELIESLREIFRKFDGYYDSDLFTLHPVDQVYVEGQTINNIINGLYEIPGGLASYDFSIIDADILGEVYEQYLGHVSTIVKQRAKETQRRKDLGLTTEPIIQVTAKKQVRKEHGIYYTPNFVTDYMVKETLGRLIKERNESDILNIKILDPACGSGSFIIRAYEELLNYHAGENATSVSELDPGERLTILTDCIFGVDFDKQAVEIARLNLLLRSLARREILPSLANNIREGDSLVSGTKEELKSYFGNNWLKRKPFQWEEEFRDIMAQGGFDVVMGNPPYGAEFDEQYRAYIKDTYPYSKDNMNSAMVFIEKGLSLTKEGGYFSFIIPKSLAYSQKWASGRKLILDKLGIACDTSKAFKEVLLEQMVIVVSHKFSHKRVYNTVNLKEDGTAEYISIHKDATSNTDTILMGLNEKELNIFNKLTSSKVFMRDISKTFRGAGYQRHLTKDPHGIPIYRGSHISRYYLRETMETIPQDKLTSAEKKVSTLCQPKILSQQILAHVTTPIDRIILMSTFDNKGVLTLDTIQNTVITDKKFDYKFITGLLNSKLWSWYAYRFIYSKAIRTMHFDEYYLGKFPLPPIDFSNAKHRDIHDDIVVSVDQMLELNDVFNRLSKYEAEQKQALQKKIKQTDITIDKLIYKLYELNDDEIGCIEK